MPRSRLRPPNPAVRAPRRAVRALAASMTAALLTLAAAQGVPADWPHPSELEPPPVDFQPPEPTRVELSNGIPVYLLEDPALPLVQGVAYVAAPPLYDPEGKTGLASMTAALLREGGAGGLSPDALDVALETLAASVEAGAAGELASVSFNALSDTLDEVMPLWRDVLVRPDFDPERLEVTRQRQLEAIRRVVDDPVQLAVREFYARLASGHPSGASPSEASIEAITRDDLRDFHGRYYAPAATALAVTGDFDTDEMVARLEALLGDWQQPRAAPPALEPLDLDPEPRVFYAPKDISQSVVLVGHPSVLAYTPAYNDLDVVNHLLGGGFSSRLFQEIRTRRGLAYATGSFVTQGFSQAGNFVAYAITPAQATGEVLTLLLDEIRRLQREGVSDEELARGRETILNRSLFRFNSAAAVTERAARVALLGLEPGYYERYLENLQAIDRDELQRAAREELRPERMVVMVVGNDELFDRPLSEFGEVEVIELP